MLGPDMMMVRTEEYGVKRTGRTEKQREIQGSNTGGFPCNARSEIRKHGWLSNDDENLKTIKTVIVSVIIACKAGRDPSVG
jgi:hypothetical protein